MKFTPELKDNHLEMIQICILFFRYTHILFFFIASGFIDYEKEIEFTN